MDTRTPVEKDRDRTLGSMQRAAWGLLCALGDGAYCPAVPAAVGGGNAAGGGTGVGTGSSAGIGEADAGGAAIAGVSLSEYTVLPIAASRVEADLGGFGLRNAVTNVWAVGDEQELEAQVLGRSVLVRAKPVSYSFDYGDGSGPRVTQEPGAALPASVLEDSATAFETETVTSHRYKETGTYSVQVVTTFEGEYQVGDGAWVPIPGSTQVASDPYTVEIWRTKHLHVSGPCLPGTQAPGCPG
ncbi:MAG: PKD domain-containing protein [Galactobacter sp.]